MSMQNAKDESATAANVSGPAVHTYHCLCTELVLASTTPLKTLSTRTADRAIICPLSPTPSASSHYAVLHNTILDRKPTMLQRQDGFEKRYLHRCPRCELIVGYQLDESQYEGPRKQGGRREDVVYLLSEGLTSTEEMEVGESVEGRTGLVAANG